MSFAAPQSPTSVDTPALREPAIDFADVVAHDVDGILGIASGSLQIVYVNAAGASMLGYEPDEVTAMTLGALLAGDDRAAARMCERHLQASGELRAERVLVRKDGTRFAAALDVRRGGDGSYYARLRDVTTARLRERALRDRAGGQRCLYAVSEALATADAKACFRRAIGQIPQGWQFPRITVARAVVDGVEYASRGYRETAWRHTVPIERGGETFGSLEVGYLEPPWAGAADGADVFLPEEWQLLRALAGMMAEAACRHRLVALRRDSEARFRALADNVTDILTIEDAEGTVRYVGSALEEVLGYSREECIGRSAIELVHPDDAGALSDMRSALRREPNATVQLEVRLRHQRGHWVEVETTGRNLLHDSAAGELVIHARHITDRPRVDPAVRHSDARLRALLANVGDIITMLDAAGNVLYESPARRDILGDAAAQRGGGIWPLSSLHAEDLTAARQALAYALEHPGETFSRRLRVRHADGEYRTLECRARNLLHDPAVGGIVVTARDVTDRIHLENQLRHAQKMEAVGRLAGGVAHDFNNILTAITGFSTLMLEELSPDDPLHEDALEIERASARAAALTRQLLAFSRRQVMQAEVVSLADTVEQLHKMLHRVIGEHIELLVEPAPDTGLVRVDVGQLEQVVMNLVVNARDAMPDGGRLMLSTERVVVTSESAEHAVPPGAYAVLDVLDTGRGMEPETLERAFEPFFTNKVLGEGTGLGLSTVFGIVSQSGGYVSATSEPLCGTRIRIHLPEVIPARRRPTPARGLPRLGARGEGVVLVVEDETAVRQLVRRVLVSAGYRVREACDGAAALAILADPAEHFDLVLSDVVMPEMSGPQLASRLEELRSGLPVLFMSGYAGRELEAARLSAERDSFLAKPFTPEQLLDRVQRALNR